MEKRKEIKEAFEVYGSAIMRIGEEPKVRYERTNKGKILYREQETGKVIPKKKALEILSQQGTEAAKILQVKQKIGFMAK